MFWKAGSWIVAGAVYFVLSSNLNVSLPDNRFDNTFLWVIGVFAAVYFWLILSEMLMKLPFFTVLEKLGKNTAGIMIWHFLAFRLTIMIQIVVLNGHLDWLVSFPVYNSDKGWWMLYIICGLAGSMFVDYVLHHNPLSQKLKR